MSSGTKALLAAFGGLGLAGGAVAYDRSSGGHLSKVASEWYQNVEERVLDVAAPLTEPTREKLLPDFPPCPPGHENLRTLVVDLEDTLCHLEWDRKYGWRTAKRPGVDQFLMAMAKSYEVVIFTSGHFHFVEPIVMQLDPFGCVAHRLYRESTRFEKGKHIKDLTKLNRDLSRVIIVDDDLFNVTHQTENGIKVKPYKDVHDRSDATLLNLIPFLEDIVLRNVKDVRVELAKYEGKDVGEEFQKVLRARQQAKAERKKKGLGGAIRGGWLKK